MNSSKSGHVPDSNSKPANLKKQLWFGFFVAAVVWVCCAYAHFGKLIDAGDFFAVGNTRDGVQTNDSVLFYASGDMARNSLVNKSSLYDSEQYRQKIDALISPIKVQERVLLQYPPHFFLSLLPLPSFTITGAWIYTSVVSVIFLLLAIRNIVFASEASKFIKALIVALAFLWYPSYWCFRLGQNSLALLFVVSIVWMLLHKKRWAAAGATAAIGIFKVQYLPIMAVVGLVLGRLSFLKGLLAGALVVALVSVVCFGPENLIAFPHSMLSGEHANSAGPYMMDTVRGLLSIFPGIFPAKIVSIISAAALVAGSLLVAVLWRNFYPRLLKTNFPYAFELCGSVSIIILMITSLHSFIQDYSMLLIAGYWTYKANTLVAQKDPANKLARLTNVFLLTLPAVSWAYGFLPAICFFLKLMLWWSIMLLVSNLLILRKIEKLFAVET